MLSVYKQSHPLQWRAITLLTLLCFSMLFVRAQQAGVNTVKEINVGEVMPDVEFQVKNYSKPTVRLSDFKGKLIVLDFWATNCTNCIAKFPHIDSLQREYPDKIQVITINQNGVESEEKVSRFLRIYNKNKPRTLSLPIAIKDSIVEKMFPHKSVPHVVYIDPAGVVKGITFGYELTADLVKDIHAGRPVSFTMKKEDMEYDRKLPLFFEGNGGVERSILRKSTITGHLPGLSGTAFTKDSSGKFFTKCSFLNISLLSLYQQAYLTFPPKSHIVYEVKDKNKFCWDGMQDYERWEKNNTYSYEVICPKLSLDEFYAQLKNDLVSYFGITAKKEKRMIDCILLVRDPAIKIKPTNRTAADLEEDESMMQLSFVEARLNTFGTIPVFTELPMKEYFKVTIPKESWDLASLQQMLKGSGLTVQGIKKEVELFVITESSRSRL